MKYLIGLIFTLQLSYGLIIDDFKNLSLGDSWKYSTENYGSSAYSWNRDSTEISLLVSNKQVYQDSIAYEITFNIKNIYYKSGALVPRDTSIDTIYVPYSFRTICTKYTFSGQIIFRDTTGRDLTLKDIHNVFRHSDVARQFGIRDYGISAISQRTFNGDTLNFYSINDSAFCPFNMGYGETLWYVDSIGFIYHTSHCRSTFGETHHVVSLVELNSIYFSPAQLIAVGIQSRINRKGVKNNMNKIFKINGRIELNKLFKARTSIRK